ncbi:MAG: hypothetical protein IKW18_06260 [Clostridia bacterium]|nr:hypothetical protein [Clostridia bacterium]
MKTITNIINSMEEMGFWKIARVDIHRNIVDSYVAYVYLKDGRTIRLWDNGAMELDKYGGDNMNITKAYIFIAKEYENRALIFWEYDDVKCAMNDDDYILIGVVDYDTEAKKIVKGVTA